MNDTNNIHQSLPALDKPQFPVDYRVPMPYGFSVGSLEVWIHFALNPFYLSISIAANRDKRGIQENQYRSFLRDLPLRHRNIMRGWTMIDEVNNCLASPESRRQKRRSLRKWHRIARNSTLDAQKEKTPSPSGSDRIQLALDDSLSKLHDFQETLLQD